MMDASKDTNNEILKNLPEGGLEVCMILNILELLMKMIMKEIYEVVESLIYICGLF